MTSFKDQLKQAKGPDSEAQYALLRGLAQDVPDLATGALSTEDLIWLGRLHALVEVAGNVNDLVALNHAVEELNNAPMADPARAAKTITAILYRALGRAELKAPEEVQGAFIPVGNPFDAVKAVSKVLRGAKRNVLIVDPYMDEKILTDFAVLAPEQVTLRLLTAADTVKPSLKPTAGRWVTQHAAKRPLECRVAPAHSLHDRLIIVDGTDAWVLTQSFKDLAARAPASLVKSAPDVAALKVPAFESQWASATPI